MIKKNYSVLEQHIYRFSVVDDFFFFIFEVIQCQSFKKLILLASYK